MCHKLPITGDEASHHVQSAVPHDVESTPSDSEAAEAVARYIHSRINFEQLPTERYGLKDFKLERMRSLLQRLGEPQQRPAVHIAGTKGKGSTAAMIAAMLQAAGRRVGLFTSPHVVHFGERMTVNGHPPTGTELLALLHEIQPVVESMDGEEDALRPTFFEVLTAMAWLHFRNRDAEIVVLETGLGGRLDATNVCTPLICVITSISRDHERLLGSTLTQIAREKAGIVKPRVPLLSGVTSEEPREVIRDVAAGVGVSLWELDQQVTYKESAESARDRPPAVGPRKLTVDVRTPWRDHHGLDVPLAGRHQAGNLALAVASVDLLDSQGWGVTPQAITEGLASLNWPLRVEVIQQRPLVIVDAAHNVASIAALVDTLADVPARQRIGVFGAARDKDSAGMLSLLSQAFDRVILTRFASNPRSVTRSHLEELAQSQLCVPWEWSEDPVSAWHRVQELIAPRDLVCATGSFFLAAEFRSVVLSVKHAVDSAEH